MFGIGRYIKRNILRKRKFSYTITNHENKSLFHLENSNTFQSQLKAYFRANLFNQIALANPKPGTIVLYTPWDEHPTFHLERLDSSHLSFNKTPGKFSRPVRIFSMPKSGTHIITATLKNLGFLDSKITFPWMNRIRDDRSQSSLIHSIPQSLMVNLQLPGTFQWGHIADLDSNTICNLHGTDKIILCIRDLRTAIVSFLRWRVALRLKRYPNNNDVTEKAILDFLYTEYDVDFLFKSAAGLLKILHEPFVRLVRFEEMIQPTRNGRKNSIEAIADAIDCPLEDVYQAVEQVLGHKTETYSGKTSALDGYWTQKVENKFIALGGDVINEQLGYSRSYVSATSI